MSDPKSPPLVSTDLKRDLHLLDCALIVIGSVIGSGIFLTPGRIAHTVGSVESMFLVWVAGGLLSLFGALSYAELGGLFPRSGGIYVFLRETYGTLPAFLYGWCVFFVIQTGSIATLAAAFVIYIGYLLPVTPAIGKVIAIAVIGVLTLFNCLGVRAGARVQNLLTVVKIGSLVGISLCLILAGKGNWSHYSYVPPVTHSFSWGNFGIAMIAALWAYQGWHILTYNAGEVENPQRNFTRGLILGTGLVVVLYLTANLAYLYALPFDRIAGTRRIASDAMELAIGPFGGTLIAVLILISISGAINANVLGGPRVYFAMAKENLFFEKFSYVHPHYRVPSFSIILQTVWACTLALVGSFERLFSYVIFVDWLFYGLGGVAVLLLRRRRPNLERPYRTWGYPWIPILFSLGAFLVVFNTVVNSFKDAFWGLVVVATGLPAYWYWSRHKECNISDRRK